MIKICHITTVHPVYDVRIFRKECISLKKYGFDVHLIVPSGGEEYKEGIYIHSLPKSKNRKERMLKIRKLAFEKALEIDADLYHFHDPELIPIGLKLKKLGKKVIYDVHEDVPRQILSKPYLNKWIRPIISQAFEIYENWASKKFDALITATPHIRDRFIKINPNTIDVNNFPILEELFEPVKWENRENAICYIGGISRIRGIVELIKALEYTNITLHLAGNFESKQLKREIMNLKGWKKVKYYGFVDRNKVKDILSKVKAGVLNFLPLPNHIHSQPNKIFEYMSAGIPVVASNFPLWQDIIEKNEYGKCGICVDPLNPKEIASAINYLVSNDREAKRMGKIGRRLVEEKYNWENESKKLLKVYQEVLKS